jgi:KUP system potassium uptake protein
MSSIADTTASAANVAHGASHENGGHAPKGSLGTLMIGAVGVVFGDIGTSPLYALKESFAGHHPLTPDTAHIMGVISLMFWSMMIVVSVKYCLFIMRADNKGEGGSLALLAMINRKVAGASWTAGIVLLGVFATALFYGDAMITPAMSVLSAVEGMKVVNPALGEYVVPISLFILVFLFLIQSRGTTKVGQFFGPIMILYFATLGVLGVINIVKAPEILAALNPWHAVNFFILDEFKAFLALGSVVLAVTGAEALYADMGHFGKKPIRYAWAMFALPALVLNYLGQGALLISAGPEGAMTILKSSPFFLLAPEWALIPLVILATMATVIASQAVITGAFSVTQQAIQLGFLPRLSIKFTSADAQGQIYIPFVNWMLMACVIFLVMGFQSSSNLAAAYGIAVTGAMAIDTILIGVVMLNLWNWKKWQAWSLLTVFAIVDIAYLGSNLFKVPDGGWVPLVIGLIIFTLLTTWSRGRALMIAKLRESAMPIDVFIKSACSSVTRVPGTAVFLTSTSDGVPPGLLHNMKHNKILHERIVFLTVKIADVPVISEANRLHYTELGNGFSRLIVNYGFMQETDVPAALKACKDFGPGFKMMETSFFLNRQTLIASPEPGMAIWREHLFSWMLRNATNAMEFFRLPTNRVVELGSQVEI